MKEKEAKLKQDDPFHRPMADPQGSYTGVPRDPEEKPVQDADDL